MQEQKTDECIRKVMEATKDDFPAILFFSSSAEGYGFVLMAVKEQKLMPKLMAQITRAMLDRPELYSMIKEIMKKVDMEKGLN